jgi:hypothetical protein
LHEKTWISLDTSRSQVFPIATSLTSESSVSLSYAINLALWATVAGSVQNTTPEVLQKTALNGLCRAEVLQKTALDAIAANWSLLSRTAGKAQAQGTAGATKGPAAVPQVYCLSRLADSAYISLPVAAPSSLVILVLLVMGSQHGLAVVAPVACSPAPTAMSYFGG